MTNDYFNNNTEGCEKLKSENFSCCLKKKVKTGRKEEREGGAKPSVRGVERAKERRGGARDALGRRREERSAPRRELLRRKAPAQEASPRRQLFRSVLGSSSGRAGS